MCATIKGAVLSVTSQILKKIYNKVGIWSQDVILILVYIAL